MPLASLGRLITKNCIGKPQIVALTTQIANQRVATRLRQTVVRLETQTPRGDMALWSDDMADEEESKNMAQQDQGEAAQKPADQDSPGRRGGGRRKGPRQSQGQGQDQGQGRDVQVSKALSRLLRHRAEEAGIQLDGEGYAPLDRVLSWGVVQSLKLTVADIMSVVASSDKQRFSLKPNPKTNPSLSTTSPSPSDYLIRANQGHSIKLDASSTLLEPITLEAGNVPPRVLHGTYLAFWPAIVAAGGLRPMGRNHVHCSVGTPEDGVVSGMRADAELVVEIDVERSLREGMQWGKSENGVVLTEGAELGGVVSTRFFKLVTGRPGVDVGVLWRDGEKVADLPTGVKGKTPFGKALQGRGRGGRGWRGGRGGRGGRGNRGGRGGRGGQQGQTTADEGGEAEGGGDGGSAGHEA